MGDLGSFVNKIVSGAGSALTPQNTFNPQDPGYQNLFGASQNNLSQNFQNQNALAQALLLQSQGQGPNLAEGQLDQATDQSNKQAAGMIASQKGINAGLAQKQILDQNAQNNQMRAGQSAQLRGQQQLNAQSALGSMYGQIGNQNLQNSSSAISGLTNTNQINAGVSAQNAAADQKTTGGLLQAGGTALGLAHGGMVPNAQLSDLAWALMSNGGEVQDPSSVPQDSPLRMKTQFDDPSSIPQDSKLRIKNMSDGGTTDASESIAQQIMRQAGVPLYGTGVPDYNFKGSKQDSNAPTPNADALIAQQFAPQTNFNLGYGDQTPSAMPSLGADLAFSDGGRVPGKPLFGGDDPINDTVPAMLSPGEIVIPISKTETKTAAKKFVDTQINKNKAKLQNESDNEYTFQGADGKPFRVAKGGISKELLEKIKQTGNRYFDGSGDVGSENALQSLGIEQQDPMMSQAPSPIAQPDQTQAPVIDPNRKMQMPSAFAMAKGEDPNGPQPVQPLNTLQKMFIPGGLRDDLHPTQNQNAANILSPAQAPQDQTPHADQPQATNSGQLGGHATSSGGSPFNSIFNREMALVDQQGKLQDIAQMHQAKAYDDYLGNLAQQQQQSDLITKQFQTQQDQLHQAITNSAIDPHRFWNSKDSGSKTSSIIGLILAGAGAGMTGQPNMAYQALQTNIDRDIDAQKAEVGKKQNLYAMNLAKYKDDMAAQAATRSTLLTVASAQMQKQAAIDGSPQALLNAQMNINNIRLEKAKLSQQFGSQMAMNAFYGAGRNPNMEGGAPVSMEGALAQRQVPYAKVLQGGSERLYPTRDKETASQMAKVEPLYRSINTDLKELEDLPTLASKFPGEAKAKADVLRARLIENIARAGSEQLGATRVPEQAVHLTQDTLGNLGSLTDPNAKNKIRAYADAMRSDLESTRQQNLIGYKGLNSLGAKPGFK